MSKSRKKKEKRKRDRISRTLPSSSDHQPDQGHRNQVVDRHQKERELVDKDSDMSMDNKKFKKKTKTNLRDDGEQRYSLSVGDDNQEDGTIDVIEPKGIITSSVQQLQDEQPLKNSERETERLPKKKKRKKKKRAQKVLSSSVFSINHQNNNDVEDHDGGRKNDADNEKIKNDNNEDGIVLEGSMVSDILVLIDRKAGKVYSATEERLEDGERKQVGHLDEEGRVIFFSGTEKRENDSPSLANNTKSNNNNDENPCSTFPYHVDPDDHCESPLDAYEDIVPLLESYGRRIHKRSTSHLSIYDPYFCDGRVARHLESLGFPEVYNRKEDCYEVWKDPSLYPSYDIFLTNPPYSADHVEKLMQHVTSKQNKNKPWMLLMPNFVHKKDYFQQLTSDTGQLPVYLVPRKRYVYQPPPNMRTKKASSTHKKCSPFVSMWYLWGGSREVTDEWYRVLWNQHSTAFDVARSKSALRDLRRKPKKR